MADMIANAETMTPTVCRLMRTLCRMKMAELAELAGVTKATINRYEQGNASRTPLKQKLIDVFIKRGVYAYLDDDSAPTGALSLRFVDPDIAEGFAGALHQDTLLAA